MDLPPPPPSRCDWILDITLSTDGGNAATYQGLSADLFDFKPGKARLIVVVANPLQ